MPVFSQHYLMHPSIPADTSYNLKSEFHKQKVHFPFIQMAIPSDSGHYRVFKNLVYEQSNDRDLHIDVFLPVHSASAVPAVLMVHGGGWRSGNKDMDHYMASQLAENGFAALCVEYRLSMEALYPAAVQDIKTAIRWTRAMASTAFPINPKKIALMGSSAGGQLVSLIGSINGPYLPYQTHTLTNVSDQVQAVIDVDGVLAFIHPESSEGADKPGAPSAATRWLGASIAADRNRWEEASALSHVHAGSAPFLFINSAQPRFTPEKRILSADSNPSGSIRKCTSFLRRPILSGCFIPGLTR